MKDGISTCKFSKHLTRSDSSAAQDGGRDTPCLLLLLLWLVAMDRGGHRAEGRLLQGRRKGRRFKQRYI